MCASVSSLFDTWWHTWSLRLLFGRGARTRCSRGSDLRALWAFLDEKAPLSSSLFSRKEGQPSASHGSGLTVAEARRGMISWGSQAELADELERGLSLSRSSAANEGERLDDECDFTDIIWSSGWCSAGLCPGRAGNVWGWWSWGWARSILLPCIWWVLEVMERATARLDLPWKRAKMVAPRGRLDERYLSGHNRSLEWASHFFQISMRRLRRNGKAIFRTHSQVSAY